jgi:hypothetical protein
LNLPASGAVQRLRPRRHQLHKTEAHPLRLLHIDAYVPPCRHRADAEPSCVREIEPKRRVAEKPLHLRSAKRLGSVSRSETT